MICNSFFIVENKKTRDFSLVIFVYGWGGWIRTNA